MSGTNGWGTEGGNAPYQDPDAPQQPRLEYDPYTGQYYDPAQRQVPQQPAQPPQQGYYDTYAGQYDTGPQPQYPAQPAPPPPPAGPGYGYPGPQPGHGGQQPPQQSYAGAGYAPGQQQYAAPPGQAPYDTGAQPVYDTGANPQFDTGAQPVYDTGANPVYDTGAQQALHDTGAVPQQRSAGPDGGPPGGAPERVYETGQFQFVREETDDAEDAIDWLKFAETRSERRDEKRRRVRSRITALLVVVVLCAAGAGGWFWWTHRDGSAPAAAASGDASGRRDVIAVHLRDSKGVTTNALLVDNQGAGTGSTLLLPGELLLPDDDNGTVPLSKALADQGGSGTRDGLSAVLGVGVAATWRLDTPYLKILVDKVGGIDLTADTEITSDGKPLLVKGANKDVSGNTAVTYATHQGSGETADARLARFGAVMDAVLAKMPTDAKGAGAVVASMNAVMDPSLSEAKLAAALASLAKERQAGKYRTVSMPVAKDGSLPADSAGKVVKDVLGGAIKSPVADGSARVSLRDATGAPKTFNQGRAALVNGGYTIVPGGGTAKVPQAKSQVAYADDKDKKTAEDVAVTLGLPKSAAVKSKTPQTADLAVTLGQDYKG